MITLAIAYLIVITVSTILLSFLSIKFYRLLLKYKEWYKSFLEGLLYASVVVVFYGTIMAVIWAFFTVFGD
jgi:hypothetical protein